MIPFLKFLEFVKVVTKYAKTHILIVYSVLRIMSQVEHTKKCNSNDGESNSVKQNANHRNHLIVCFYMLL